MEFLRFYLRTVLTFLHSVIFSLLLKTFARIWAKSRSTPVKRKQTDVIEKYRSIAILNKNCLR